jgi:hypothetical protein
MPLRACGVARRGEGGGQVFKILGNPFDVGFQPLEMGLELDCGIRPLDQCGLDVPEGEREVIPQWESVRNYRRRKIRLEPVFFRPTNGSGDTGWIRRFSTRDPEPG